MHLIRKAFSIEMEISQYCQVSIYIIWPFPPLFLPCFSCSIPAAACCSADNVLALRSRPAVTSTSNRCTWTLGTYLCIECRQTCPNFAMVASEVARLLVTWSFKSSFKSQKLSQNCSNQCIKCHNGIRTGNTADFPIYRVRLLHSLPQFRWTTVQYSP